MSLYRIYKYRTFQREEACITPSYEPRYHGATNAKVDPTAGLAVYNVDERARREAFCRQVEIVVDYLPEKQREIIAARYMKRYVPSDQQLSDRLGITRDTYSGRRLKAMVEIASLLEIEH